MISLMITKYLIFAKLFVLLMKCKNATNNQLKRILKDFFYHSFKFPLSYNPTSAMYLFTCSFYFNSLELNAQ